MSSFVNGVPRHRAKRIAIYNHKGGVGKTTLTVNIASRVARQGYRVLLVDSDPQCNLSAYYLADEYVDDLLANSDTSAGQTLWSAMSPVYDGNRLAKGTIPIELFNNRLFLIPGDIQLSKFETELESRWVEAFQRKPSGYNATIALSEFVNRICQTFDFDFVFYDCGPNVGALNRVILLDVDCFIVPGACDLFSIRALTTLGIQLRNWIIDWKTVTQLVPGDVYKLPGKPRLTGFILQRFRNYRKVMANQYARYAKDFELTVRRDVFDTLHRLDPSLTPVPKDQLYLEAVPDFTTRALKAQMAGQTIDKIGTVEQKKAAEKLFSQLAREIVKRSGN